MGICKDINTEYCAQNENLKIFLFRGSFLLLVAILDAILNLPLVPATGKIINNRQI